MTIARIAHSPEFNLGLLKITQLAVPSRGSTELCSWRVDLPPGGSSGVHSVDREQLIVVSVGRVTARLGDETLEAGPGDSLIIPTHVPVEMRNDSSEPALALVVCSIGFKATVGAQSFVPPWAQ